MRIFQKINTLTDEQLISTVVLLLAVVLGAAVRLNFISGSIYPVNDGGFFYTMINDLMDNHFRLPLYSSYNQIDIPYAYPPLAFYLLGGLHKLTGISVISLLLYIPALLSILTIPVCYSLTEIFFTEDKFSRALATYIFATLPRSFEWLVMGGGITRVLGFLFALLALLYFYRDLQSNKITVNLFAAAFFAGLTVLSHPVAVLFLGFSMIVVGIYCWPINLFKAGILGFLTLLVVSPWLVSVLSNHGLATYLGASNTGHLDWFELKYLITQNFEYENRLFLALVSVFSILGLFGRPRKRALFLGILVFGGYLFIPRGGVDLLTIYLAMLGTCGFLVVVRGWQAAERDKKTKGESFYLTRRSRILLFYLVIYTFVGSYTYKFVDGKLDLRLSPEDVQAMTWISENTDPGSVILHLPSNESYRNWPNDFIGEWLPALTARSNLSTVQGYEWLPEAFAGKVDQYLYLRSCIDYGISCVEDWQEDNDLRADFLYISKVENQFLLIENVSLTGKYTTVFENERVVVFEVQP